MAATRALVKPALLVWARQRAKVKTEDAAKAAGVTVERLAAWESAENEEGPTVSQLRLLAGKYHFPLAVFYLPEPPADFAPLRDFRRLPDAEEGTLTPNLAFRIREAYERRELALELYDELRSQPERFPIKATVRDDPEKVGQAIRDFLQVDDARQRRAASQNRIFDFWRRQIEERDVLVFVIAGPHYAVELKEMRGLAIAKPELPVIVVNGRDYSQGGKVFTLMHELAHIALGESAISNGTGEDLGSTREEQRIERFCDAVAAAVLMPRALLLSMAEVAKAGEREWRDETLRAIAGNIGVSREALLIRFITLKRATWDYYKTQRGRFAEEYREAAEAKELEPKKSAPIKRSIMLMLNNGRGFTRLVLRSYYDQRITLSDVSSYLGARVKHIPDLERAAFQRAE